MSSFDDSASNITPDPEPTPKVAKVQPVYKAEAGCSGAQNGRAEPVCSFSHQPDETVDNTEEEEEIDCAGCTALQTQNRILRIPVSLHKQLGKQTPTDKSYYQ